MVSLTGSNPPLTWMPKVKEEIDFLLKHYPNKEWSGVLFYEIEGTIKDIKNLKVIVHDMFVMDVGTGGSSSFNWDEELVGFMMDTPGIKTMRKGDIHSHHTMQAYFSGTDWADVGKNSNAFDWLLSIVVSSTHNWVGKIIARASHIVQIEMIDEKRESFKVEAKQDEGVVVISYDLDMGYKPKQFNVSDNFMERLKTLEERKLRGREQQYSQKDYGQRYQGTANYNQWIGKETGQNLRDDRSLFPQTGHSNVPKDVPPGYTEAWNQKVLEFMKRWLYMDISTPAGTKSKLNNILKTFETPKNGDSLIEKEDFHNQAVEMLIDNFEESYTAYFATPEDLKEFPVQDVVDTIMDKLEKFLDKYNFANALWMELDIAEFFEDEE